MLTPRAMRPQAGIGLVEMLVGVAVGLLLLVGLSSVYVSTARGGRTTTQVNALSQETRAVMDIMVNDLRRAGHWGAPAEGVSNPFTAANTRPSITVTGGRGCILYAYDSTYQGGDVGVVNNGDLFGFRLTAGGVVQMVSPGQLAWTANNNATGAGNTGFCGSAVASDWQDLTDQRAINVTELSFDTGGSKCIAFKSADYDPLDPGTYKQWPDPPFPPSIDWPCDTLPSGVSAATHQRIETRQVRITLTARSRTDPTLPPLTLSETVLLRNNRVMVP